MKVTYWSHFRSSNGSMKTWQCRYDRWNILWTEEPFEENMNSQLTNSKIINLLLLAFCEKADTCLLFGEEGQADIWEQRSEAIPKIFFYRYKGDKV